MTIKCYNDRITKRFTPEFFEDKPYVEYKGNNDYTFKLYNPENKTSCYLTVVCASINKKGEEVDFHITGSLRKWWYGGMSVKDFSKQDFETAINRLFDILEVSKKKKIHFFISSIEIGLNINVKLSCSEIVKRIVEYKNSHYERKPYKTGIKYESKKIMGIKMYDKVEEIAKKFKDKLKKKPEEEQFLKDYAGKNIMRIEFKIQQKANMDKKLSFNNLEDCITYFGLLYFYFWGQIQYIQYSDAYNNMPYMDCKGKSDKEFNDYLRYVGIWYLGIERIEEMTKELKNRTMRGKIKSFFEKDSYKNPTLENCPYDENAFMMDIKRQILYSMKDSKFLKLFKDVILGNPFLKKKKKK